MRQKILLALQFWHGDKAQALKVARLIADLEPGMSEHADFLFISRFDTGHDQPTVEHVSRKFHTFTHICPRRGVGWPSGCNDLMFGTMDWVYSHIEADRIPRYKAVMLLESDSCPLHNGWIRDLHAGWDRANVKMYGPLLPNGPHINGNCMMSCEHKFLKWVSREMGGCSPQGGWDYILFEKFKRWGVADASTMRSWWRIKDMPLETYESLVNQGVCFLHGCKDDSLINHVRRRHSL